MFGMGAQKLLAILVIVTGAQASVRTAIAR